MKVLLLGSTGATGRHALRFLLNGNHQVIAPVRSSERLEKDLRDHKGLTIHEETILDLPETEVDRIVSQCDAAISCLGHNLNFRGIYGKPRRLVLDSVRTVCESARKSERQDPFRFVLMCSSGVVNSRLQEKIPVHQKAVTGLLRNFLPPHADNEESAAYLLDLPSDGKLESVVVRPDALVDEATASEYVLHKSPTRSAIFDSGKTSRINVGRFIHDLLTDDPLWQEWKSGSPVIYNAGSD